MTTQLPTWLTTTNSSHSPFDQETRTHLLQRARKDPRLGELVGRLQEKGSVGSDEWAWARRVTRGDQRVMKEIHATFAPDDENDILKLAAYASDHSYAHFFTEYLHTGDNKRSDYHEMIEHISPILADLQPAVAIGFAPQILEVYTQLGKRAEAEELFASIAEQHPAEVMHNYPRLKEFANYNAIVAVAGAKVEEQAPNSPQQQKFADQVRMRRAIDAQREGLQP